MVIAYGCGRGMVHRNVQRAYRPPEADRAHIVVLDVEERTEQRFEDVASAALALGCSEKQVERRLSGEIKAPLYGLFRIWSEI